MAPVIPLTQRQDWKYSSEERKCRISHIRKFQVWVTHTLLSQYLRGHHEVLGKDSCTSLLVAETFPIVDRCKLEDFHHFKQREKADFNDNALTAQTDLFIRGFFFAYVHTHINLCFRSKAPLAWKLHLPFVEWSLGCWISQVCCCCFRPSALLAVLRCSQPRTTEYCFCWSLFIGDLWLPVNHRTLL